MPNRRKKKARRARRRDQEAARYAAAAAAAVAAIEQAFDGAPAPDPHHRTLHQAEAWDRYEATGQQRDHSGRWQELPASHLAACPNAIPHLDEQGIRYYLPAIMISYLTTPPRRRTWLHESLLYCLTPATGDLKAHQRRRFGLLNHDQRAAVLAFLEEIGAPEEERAPWRRVIEAGDDPDWFRRFY